MALYWLPRLIDKARACDGGDARQTICYGQSPMIGRCCERFGWGHREFTIDPSTPVDDASVLAAVTSRGMPDAPQRARAWSETLACDATGSSYGLSTSTTAIAPRGSAHRLRPPRLQFPRTAKRLWLPHAAERAAGAPPPEGSTPRRRLNPGAG